jgi:uncharacterized protein (TIGR03435 family)
MHRAVLFSLLASAAWAQQAAPPPAFEVASVKVAEQPQAQMVGGGGMVYRAVRAMGCRKPDPGLVNCTSATMKQLLMQAYDVKSYQIQGPAWLDTERFDLMAKIPEGVPVDQVPVMLQALLADRFKVTLHKETKSLPAYELTVAKGGPKLTEVDPAEVAAAAAAAAERAAGGAAALPPPPSSADAAKLAAAMAAGRAPGRGPLPAGAFQMMMSSSGARTIRGKMTIAQLANTLTGQVGRPIFDATGLKGTYDIELTYLGDENDAMGSQMRSLAAAAGAAAGAGAATGGDSPGPRQQEVNTPTATLTQAFQQSLGLKLEAKKMPVDLIVVDSANKVPTEN